MSGSSWRAPDVLTWPLIGRFLKWRHARAAMQVPLLALAALIVFDGLFGPQLAPKNLATVGVWLHYRGLVVLVLLVAGNLFCMACPFMLPRRAGRWLRERLWGGGRPIPHLLRNKWLAVALVLLFFFVYERFGLWASPWLTAWIALAYFVVAFAVDTLFRGAAFCKHICPLGQFNFFGALISPLEVKVRRADVCTACRTKDCIRGRMVSPASEASGDGRSDASIQTMGLSMTGAVAVPEGAGIGEGRVDVRGCELALFLPRKAGNMDCTFCLDCIHACPHNNIGMIGRVPTVELWRDPYRSGIGRFSQRADLAVLLALLVFGSFVNAFAMIRPVYALRAQIATWLGGASPTLELLLVFLFGLLILPALLLIGAGLLTRGLAGGHTEPLPAVISRYVYALVPLGFGMWLAHYSFHFLTGGLTILPVAQSFLADLGLYAGPVRWGAGPLVPGEWLFPIEGLFLYVGAFGSIVTAFQITRIHQPLAANDRAAILRAALPWIILILLLLAVGLAILIQPMEMRGTFHAVGTTGG